MGRWVVRLTIGSSTLSGGRPGSGDGGPVGGIGVGGLVVGLLELLSPAGREPVPEDRAAGVVGLVLEGARQQAVPGEPDGLAVETLTLHGGDLRPRERD